MSAKPELDFETAALAAGLVVGLTFLLGQARSYLDRAVSDARDAVKQQDADLQNARKGGEICLAGQVTLARYAAAPSLIRLLAQLVQGLVRRPPPADDQVPLIQRVKESQRERQRDFKRSQAHPLNEPGGIAISFLILLAALIFSIALVVILTILLFSVGWAHLSAHPAVTGSTLIVNIVFMGTLAVFAWLTARDAMFDLMVLARSESTNLARWVETAEREWGTYRLYTKYPKSDRAREASEARRKAQDACKKALRIYSKVGQALHIQGALYAVDALELKILKVREREPLLKGVVSLNQIPNHLVPVVSPSLPDPNFLLAWLLQELGDESAAVDALVVFLLFSRPYSPELPGATIQSDLWLAAYREIERTKPESLSTDVFFACEEHLREDPKSWVQLASTFAKQGQVSQAIALDAARELLQEHPEDEGLRGLISQLDTEPDASTGPQIATKRPRFNRPRFKRRL
jgi:hypothetical protein